MFLVLAFAMTCKIIAWLLLLSSVPCVYLIIQTHFSTTSAHKVHGRVVDHIAATRGKGGITYSLRVAYNDRNGTKHYLQSGSSASVPVKDRGDTVIVLEYSDGSKSDLLLFGDLFMCYLVWLFVSIFGSGLIIGTDIMEWLYG